MTGVHRVTPAEWAEEPGWADAVRAVIDQATAADRSAPVDEAVELMLARHGLEHAALWVGGPDPVRGFALVHWRDDGPASLELAVAPDARGRGVGTALAAAALASRPDPWAAWSHSDDPAAEALAQRHGFEATRSLWVMRLAPEVAVPEPATPRGVTLRGYRPHDADGVVEVNAQAFADHPEQGAMDLASFRERASQEWFDPEGLIVAERDGEVVGFHWTKTHRATDRQPAHGEVYLIGVAPSMHGSGLGTALLAAGIQRLRGLGLEQVALYVESDSRAIGLYERMGFTHADDDTHVQYTRG